MIEFKCYTLTDIMEWSKEGSLVSVPALQRGLVWSPKQVEFLWDSLLRSFPIGNFILIKHGKETNQHYDLLDGQQRANSIRLGWNKDIYKTGVIVWLDVEPYKEANSSRCYFVKVTTDAHPWGYKNDDACSTLSTAEKNDALIQFGKGGTNIYKTKINLKETWPIYAGFPIPLNCFLEARTDNLTQFTEDVENAAIHSGMIDEKKLKEKSELIGEFYDAFRQLRDYRIGCSILPNDILLSNSENTGNSNVNSFLPIEILFQRLNRGGTPISNEDLNYSAIKTYWPGIKKVNDHIAAKYMAPEKLAHLAFRLVITSIEGKNLAPALNVQTIRSYSNNSEICNRVNALYGENCTLEKILYKIDLWLGIVSEHTSHCGCATPAFLRNSIINRSPDVYLLLMCFALRDLENPLHIDAKYIKALAFLLHWFYATNKTKAVNEVMTQCSEKISVENIKKAITAAQRDCWILPVYSSNELYENYTHLRWEKDWDYSDAPCFAKWKHLFNRIAWYNQGYEAKEMLIYAEREYINSNFSLYDPARKDMWDTYNRPWDYDHITPQNWINKRGGKYRNFCKTWLGCIGNIAAIPYSVNRSKSDCSDYSEYEKNRDFLLFDEQTKELTEDITHQENMSNKFASVTFERFCKIYAKVYECISYVIDSPCLSDNLQERKNLMLAIKNSIPNSKIYFATEDMKDIEVGILDWSREWLGVGLELGEYFACFEWSAYREDGEIKGAEIGIRKKTSNLEIKQDYRDLISKHVNLFSGYEETKDNPWWYLCKRVDKLDVNGIIENLKTLIKGLNIIAIQK